MSRNTPSFALGAAPWGSGLPPRHAECLQNAPASVTLWAHGQEAAPPADNVRHLRQVVQADQDVAALLRPCLPRSSQGGQADGRIRLRVLRLGCGCRGSRTPSGGSSHLDRAWACRANSLPRSAKLSRVQLRPWGSPALDNPAPEKTFATMAPTPLQEIPRYPRLVRCGPGQSLQGDGGIRAPRSCRKTAHPCPVEAAQRIASPPGQSFVSGAHRGAGRGGKEARRAA